MKVSKYVRLLAERPLDSIRKQIFKDALTMVSNRLKEEDTDISSFLAVANKIPQNLDKTQQKLLELLEIYENHKFIENRKDPQRYLFAARGNFEKIAVYLVWRNGIYPELKIEEINRLLEVIGEYGALLRGALTQIRLLEDVYVKSDGTQEQWIHAGLWCAAFLKDNQQGMKDALKPYVQVPVTPYSAYLLFSKLNWTGTLEDLNNSLVLWNQYGIGTIREYLASLAPDKREARQAIVEKLGFLDKLDIPVPPTLQDGEKLGSYKSYVIYIEFLGNLIKILDRIEQNRLNFILVDLNRYRQTVLNEFDEETEEVREELFLSEECVTALTKRYVSPNGYIYKSPMEIFRKFADPTNKTMITEGVAQKDINPALNIIYNVIYFCKPSVEFDYQGKEEGLYNVKQLQAIAQVSLFAGYYHAEDDEYLREWKPQSSLEQQTILCSDLYYFVKFLADVLEPSSYEENISKSIADLQDKTIRDAENAETVIREVFKVKQEPSSQLLSFDDIINKLPPQLKMGASEKQWAVKATLEKVNSGGPVDLLIERENHNIDLAKRIGGMRDWAAYNGKIYDDVLQIQQKRKGSFGLNVIKTLARGWKIYQDFLDEKITLEDANKLLDQMEFDKFFDNQGVFVGPRENAEMMVYMKIKYSI